SRRASLQTRCCGPATTSGSGASCRSWARASRTTARRISIFRARPPTYRHRSEEHTSELQSLTNLVCRLLLEKKKKHVANSPPQLFASLYLLFSAESAAPLALPSFPTRRSSDLLETGEPANPLLRAGHHVWFRRVVPLVGARLAHDSEAYQYLPRSTAYLPAPGELLALVIAAGFAAVERHTFTAGAVQLVTGTRR